MVTYTDGSITYEVSMDTKNLLENSGKVREQLLKMCDNGELAAKGINKLEKSATGASAGLGKLATVAKMVSAALVSSQIIAYAQSWNELEDRIGNTGATAIQTKEVMNSLLETSNRNGRTIEESSELYIRLSNSMKELGYSSNDTLSYIDTLSNLMTINKTNTMSAETAINALTKAQMKGKLSGVEAMSVFNAMPSILKTLGTQLNKTEAEVRQMANDGKLSMQEFSQAMIAAKDETAALADNMRNTVNDGITRVTNNLKQYLGELNNSTGATKLLVDSLVLMSEHVDILATGIGVLGAIYAGKYITSLAAATKQSASKMVNDLKLAQAEKAAAQAALQQAQAETANVRAAQASLAAQLKLAQTEQTRNAIRNQLKANTVALTAATNAETAAQARLNLAMKATAVTTNLLKGGLALIGGPAGAALLAGSALFYFYEKAKQAKDEAVGLTDKVKALSEQLNSFTDERLVVIKDDAVKNIKNAEEQLKQLHIEMASTKELVDGGLFISESRRNAAILTRNKQLAEEKDILNGILAAQNQIADVDSILASRVGPTKLVNTANDIKEALDSITKSKIADTIKDLSTQLEITEMKLNGSAKEAYIYENALGALGDSGEKYKETLKGILDGSIQWAEVSEEVRTALQPLIAMLGISFDKSEKLKTSHKSGAASTKTYADEVKSLRDKLEIAKLESQGLTVEAELLSIAQRMGSKATAAQTAELKELISASHAYKTLESLKSPIDVENDSFKKSKESLDKLFQLGELKQADYNSKIEQLEQKHQIEMAKIKSEATVSNVDAAVAQVDPVQALENENKRKLALIKEFEEQKWITEQNGIVLREAANYQYEQNRINAQWEIWKNQSAANDFLASSLEGLASSATSTIAGLASGTMNATEAMQNFANVILNEAIGSLVQMGMQYVKNAIMSQSASAATTAVQSAEAVALATAYQPAAMYASIATSGAAATIGASSYAASVGVMKSLSIAGAREHGGPVNGSSMYRVGEGGKPEILIQGGKQYLIPGENGQVLSNREMRSGQSGGGTNLTINVPINMSSSGVSEDDGKQLGNLIKKTVTTVIQEQQRAGGLLNKR